MEKIDYRENLELLREMFPGKLSLSVPETASVMGLDVKTVYNAVSRRYNPLPHMKVGEKRILIPIPGLARWMCGK
jgi:hypothetical protein